MQVLIATYAGAGHTGPCRRLRDELVAAGHRVVLVAAEPVEGGRTFTRVPPPPPGRFEDHLATYADALFGEALATEVRDLAREVGADVVATDALAPAALCGAHASGARSIALLNLPYGRLRDELRTGHGWWAQLAPRLDAVRDALGQPRYRSALDSWEQADELWLLGVPDLEDPGAALPDHLAFVGPCLRRVEPTPRGGRPRVVVSLSSSEMDHRGALQAVLDGLGALEVDVVASTARAVDPAALAAPANVDVVEWLPLPEALADADALVTHAGHGTVMAALAAGTPMVCVPLGRDQPSTAARLAGLGAGVVATPDEAGAAATRVLADPSFRTAASELRARVRALDGAAASRLAAR